MLVKFVHTIHVDKLIEFCDSPFGNAHLTALLLLDIFEFFEALHPTPKNGKKLKKYIMTDLHMLYCWNMHTVGNENVKIKRLHNLEKN